VAGGDRLGGPRPSTRRRGQHEVLGAIGSGTYQFPTYTFYYAGDVYRVCDLRVGGDGTVTILQPDDSLYAWAPSLRAPKVR
jgi:hypothetical protein